jgi:peptidoglycan/LPS O-acetylase OafA/YrhL
MFFVLSGFLITTQLFAEHDQFGTIDIGRFYARRIKRIFPASLLVVSIAGIVWATLYGPGLSKEVLTGLSAAAASLSNIYFRAASLDYFNTGSGSSPILHYWSLGVEEQFYVLFPILLVALQKISQKRAGLSSFLQLTGTTLVVVTMASFVAMILSTPTSAFYLPWFRAWELSAGGLLAYYFSSRQQALQTLRPSIRTILMFVGSAGLVVGFVYAGTFGRWPGFETTIPVVATCLLIFSLFNAKSAQTIFSNQLLRFAGRISFALYLWHWLLLGLADSLSVPNNRTDAATALAIGAAIVLAAMSTIFFEEPIRNIRIDTLRRTRLVLISGVSTAVLVLVGTSFGLPILASMAGGNSPLASSLSHVRDDFVTLRHEPGYFTETAPFRSSYAPCAYGAAGDSAGQPSCATTKLPQIVLLGDSHALSWFPPINQWAVEHGYALVVLGRSSCSPFNIANTPPGGSTVCTRWANEVWERIAVMKPALLIVTSSKYSKIAVGDTYSLPVTGARDWMGLAIEQLAQATSNATRVLLLGDVPRARFDIPDCIALHRFDASSCAMPVGETLPASYIANLEEVASSAGVSAWNPSKYICPEGVCTWIQGGTIMYIDNNHLSATFAATLGTPLGKVLSEIFSRPSP